MAQSDSLTRKAVRRMTMSEVSREIDTILAFEAGSASDASISTRPPIGAGRRPVPPIGSIGGAGDGSGFYAPLHPIEQPKPGSAPSLVGDDERSSTFGVSGTPITSAFLLDLGEYNPQLVGRAAIPVYEKIRRSDDMAWAVLNVWRLPVMSAKWDVTEPNPDNEPSRKVGSNGAGRKTQTKGKEVTKFCRENFFGGLEFQSKTGAWVSQAWQSVIYNATLMLDFGCSVHEEVWRVDGANIRLRALQQRQALTYYRWHTEADGETLTAMEQYGYRGNAFMNVTLPVEKMCRFTYRQEGANFFGIPLSRALYTPWFYKDRLKRIAAVAAEKNMLGIPVWKLQKGFSPTDKSDAFKMVTEVSAHQTTGLVEPPAAEPNDKSGFRFETPAAQGRQALQGLLQWVAYYDISMARAALAMFIQSGNTPFGSRSTTKEHADFFLLAAQSLADQIRWEIQVSTLRRLAWYNFGPDCPMPQLVAANVQARQLEDMVSLLKELSMVGLVVSDQGIRDYLRKEIAAPEETREGLVSIKSEVIDPGAVGGPTVGGKGKGDLPIAVGGKGQESDQQEKTRDGLFYHLLPSRGKDENIDGLKNGDDFILSRPVLFGRKHEPLDAVSDEQLRASERQFVHVASKGRLLVLRGTQSTNDWMKGRFRVCAVDEAGNIQAEHLTSRVNH